MASLLAWTILAGVIASAASMLALRASMAVKRAEGRNGWPLLAFWGTVSVYMVIFTLLRIAHMGGLAWDVPLFYAQTLAGASTLISLMYILFAILVGPNAARWAAESAAMIAFATVFMIFVDGVLGPFSDAWSVELVPVNRVARAAVGLFYVVTPVALSMVLVRWANHDDVAFRRRTRMFAASVVLMYVPNAGKYVTVLDGPASAALAAIMAVGAVLGWRSYLVPGGNG